LEPIRIAVVGVGLIGKRHIAAVQRSEIASVVGIVDPAHSTTEFATDLGLDCYATISDMLKMAAPDGVIIATPNQMHVENGLECIRARIPILIEKPIAVDSQSTLLLVKEAEGAGVSILVGHHRRHNPIIRAAKKQLESGAIGDVVAVHATCWLYKPDDYFKADWRTRHGAGPVFINLIHDIDLLSHLIGEIESVQAFVSSNTRNQEIEDTAVIILRFSNGALATVTVSDTIVSPWSWELTAEENPAYPKTRQNCYFIGGTHGSMEIPGGKYWSQDGMRSWWEPISSEVISVKPRDPLNEQIRHFCDIITKDMEPLVSGREGLKSLQVIEAIHKSASSCKLIHICDLN